MERESENSLWKHNSRWGISSRTRSELLVELKNLCILSQRAEQNSASAGAPAQRGSSLPTPQLKPEGVRKAAAPELDFMGKCVTIMSISKYLTQREFVGVTGSDKPCSWRFVLLQNAQKFPLPIFSSRNSLSLSLYFPRPNPSSPTPQPHLAWLLSPATLNSTDLS